MTFYLPDSNVFILAFNGREPAASFLKNAITKRAIKISVIVLAEIYGKDIIQERHSIDKLALEFGCLGIEEKIARVAGEYRNQYARKTNKSFLSDCFLAAQAKIYHLTLVTNNKSDFPMTDIKIISPNK